MADDYALVFCVGPGILLEQTCLAIRSISKFAPEFARISEVWAVSPRKDHHLSPQEERRLTDLGARYHPLNLNSYWDLPPQLNKVFATAWVEEESNTQRLLFLDSDTVFVAEPDLLFRPFESVVVRPVDRRGIGAGAYTDPDWDYWLRLSRFFSFDPERRARTVVDQKEIIPYFNAGFVGFERNRGSARQWLDLATQLIDQDLMPRKAEHIDQVALAVLVNRLGEWMDPGLAYNYPLPQRPLMLESQTAVQWAELVHIHYHRWFQSRGFLDRVTPALERTNTFTWLERQLPLTPEIDEVYSRQV